MAFLDWTPKQRFEMIDLETTSLEIKTDGEMGNGQQIRFKFYDLQGRAAGGLTIFFFSTPQYWIHDCDRSRTEFPTTLPSAKNKVWRITKTITPDIRFQIHCNDKEVLNVLMSTCRNWNWKIYWSRGVQKMRYEIDNASDYFKLSKTG